MCHVISELDEAIDFAQCLFRDERLLDVYRWGDKNSYAQTKHGIEHANDVRDLAVRMAAAVATRYPGRLDHWTQHVVAPIGAFLHDVGRSIDVANHDIAGAKWANTFLRECKNFQGCRILSDEVVNRLVRIIQCHRGKRFNKMRMVDPALDLVVLADKCIGDEDRVRWLQRTYLEGLRWVGLTWVPEYFEGLKNQYPTCWGWLPIDKGVVHHRINFAIRSASLDLDSDSEDMVLKLKLKPNVMSPSEIFGNDYYADAYHACSRAAKHLGFKFRLEFNGERFLFHDEGNPPGWVPVNTVALNRGG